MPMDIITTVILWTFHSHYLYETHAAAVWTEICNCN